jgi:hypothetical protein
MEVQCESKLVGRVLVYGCVWSKFEVIDVYERIVNLMSDIN